MKGVAEKSLMCSDHLTYPTLCFHTSKIDRYMIVIVYGGYLLSPEACT